MDDGRTYNGQMLTFGGPKEEYGLGRVEWTDGDIYEGELVDGVFDGYGRYIWNDGYMYIGQWKNKKQNGLGVYVSPSGIRQVGYFKDGKYIKGK